MSIIAADPVEASLMSITGAVLIPVPLTACNTVVSIPSALSNVAFTTKEDEDQL